MTPRALAVLFVMTSERQHAANIVNATNSDVDADQSRDKKRERETISDSLTAGPQLSGRWGSHLQPIPIRIVVIYWGRNEADS